jgi:hypothetical protein
MIDTQARDLERRDRNALVGELTAAGAWFRGSSVGCPFHDDRTPSGSIHQGDDGAWRFTCHGGDCGFSGDIFDVRSRATNKPLVDVLPRAETTAARGWPPPAEVSTRPKVYPTIESLVETCQHVAAVYRYTHPDTKAVELVVVRCEPPGEKKKIRQCRPEAGGWVLRKPEGVQPIYNRARVRKADIVFVVEGEPCVHALTDLDLPGGAATTAPGGCSKGRAEEADWSLLAGKTVYLWPDNDDGGIDHMTRVAGILEKLSPVPTLFWIDPQATGVGPKGDVADFLAARCDLTPAERQMEFDGLLRNAKPLCASRDLHDLIEDTITGRREALPWPFPKLQKLTKALLPGNVTVLCGGEGGSKSFLALACCWDWHSKGRRVDYLALERERPYHLLRLLAHLEGRWELLDDDWARENAAELRAIYAARRPELDSFAPRITAPHCEQFTRLAALDWLKRRCADGCRVAIIDPVTAMADPGELWTADLQFVMGVRAIATPAGCSVVLITHPRTNSKGRGMEPLEGLAGGAAYRRFTDTVLWLQKPKVRPSSTVEGQYGRGTYQYNRVLHLLKTRDGAGQGQGLAFDFGHNGPSFKEWGVIVGPAGGAIE